MSAASARTSGRSSSVAQRAEASRPRNVGSSFGASCRAYLSESRGALAGGAAGFCVAGPVGALIGGAVGNAASSDGCEEPEEVKRYLPKVGGTVACVVLCIASPVTAIAAGAAAGSCAATEHWTLPTRTLGDRAAFLPLAAGGAYFAKLPHEEKVAVGSRAAESLCDLASHLMSAGANVAARQWEQLNTPRLHGPSADDGSSTVDREKRRRAHAAKASAALAEDGFALHPLDATDDASEWAALERFLQTDARQLGVGKDVKGGRAYDGLRLACAWRIEHPANRRKYETSRDTKIVGQMALLERKGE
jgi:hypothetical protein